MAWCHISQNIWRECFVDIMVTSHGPRSAPKHDQMDYSFHRFYILTTQENNKASGYRSCSWKYIGFHCALQWHHNGRVASQITCVPIVCSFICSCAGQIKHRSFASLAFAREIHRWPMDSPNNGQVTRKMFPFDDITMENRCRVMITLCRNGWG